MRFPYTPIAAATAALFLGLQTAALGQTAPATPIAPGVDIPPTGFGAVGPGNVPIAPGAATNGLNLEQRGPGGGRLAPGSAGDASGSQILGTPVQPRPPGVGNGRMR
jgi:hypothetical protein